jgi:blue light- and temperature-responsive anti-repressor
MKTELNHPASFINRLNDYTDVIDVGISFAFQPLVAAAGDVTLGHEALVRGLCGESAQEIIAGVRPENLFYFDQACRMRAIADADRAGLQGTLHLNCTEVDAANLSIALESTAQAVAMSRLTPGQIVLEFSCLARLGNPRQLSAVRARANSYGFRVLADNVGVGEAGLKRLAVLRPEFVKLDRELISNVHASARRQAMVCGIVATSKALGVIPIAAGVEQAAELEWLAGVGIERFQGFYFGRPQQLTQPAVESAPAGQTMARDLERAAFNQCAA